MLLFHAQCTIDAEHEHLEAEREHMRVKEKEGWNSTGAITWQHTVGVKLRRIEESRNKFKCAHELFNEFGLVNLKWDEYFSAAIPSTIEN